MPPTLEKAVRGAVVYGAILAGAVACAAVPRTSPQEVARGPLAEAALPRDRDAIRREEEIRKEEAALVERVTAIMKRNRSGHATPETERLEAQRRLLRELATPIRRERHALWAMMRADPADPVWRYQVLADARRYVAVATDDFTARRTRMAGLRLEAVRRAGTAADSVAALEREVALRRRWVEADRRLRETWDLFLAGMNLPSIDEDRAQQARADAARAAERRSREREAAETVRALVVAFGVVAAVSAVLGSTLSTDEERREVTGGGYLAQAKRAKRDECIAQGRGYRSVDDEDIGVCFP
ncbi:MAG TPA: hypothetical protein VHG91_13120 [Longimicrobium sp.]|nr:hypothetical protein [Longimicrobium sp.]